MTTQPKPDKSAEEIARELVTAWEMNSDTMVYLRDQEDLEDEIALLLTSERQRVRDETLEKCATYLDKHTDRCWGYLDAIAAKFRALKGKS